MHEYTTPSIIEDEEGTAKPTTTPKNAIIDSSPTLQAFETRQQSLTRKEAIREHWKSIAWCFYMFFTCIMYGFDSLAGGVVVGITQFRKDFGYPFEGDYVVDANWQLGFQAATLGGETPLFSPPFFLLGEEEKTKEESVICEMVYNLHELTF